MVDMRRLGTVIAVILVSLSLSACAAKRESSIKDAEELTKATEQGEFSQTLAEAQQYWEGRGDQNNLKKSIDLMERAVKMPASDMSEEERTAKLIDTYVMLSRGYYLMADSHIRLAAAEDGDNDEEMMRIFDLGVGAAEKAFSLADPTFAKTVKEDRKKWQEAVGKADAKALPALYWYSTNLGKWALLEGIATILARKDDIKATMEWALENDPNYFHGAPYRYFGVYHTKVPIGGGDPPKSKEAFEKSLAIAPNYLATKVLMAESYAVLAGENELFEKLLNEVVAADPMAVPEIGPENKLEQMKAKKLLEKKDDLFY